jgi:hypothetical protein
VGPAGTFFSPRDGFVLAFAFRTVDADVVMKRNDVADDGEVQGLRLLVLRRLLRCQWQLKNSFLPDCMNRSIAWPSLRKQHQLRARPDATSYLASCRVDERETNCRSLIIVRVMMHGMRGV